MATAGGRRPLPAPARPQALLASECTVPVWGRGVPLPSLSTQPQTPCPLLRLSRGPGACLLDHPWKPLPAVGPVRKLGADAAPSYLSWGRTLQGWFSEGRHQGARGLRGQAAAGCFHLQACRGLGVLPGAQGMELCMAQEGGWEPSEGAALTWCRPTEQRRREAALPVFGACTNHAVPSEGRGHQKAPGPEQGLQGRMVQRQGHGQVSSYRCPLVLEGWGCQTLQCRPVPGELPRPRLPT